LSLTIAVVTVPSYLTLLVQFFRFLRSETILAADARGEVSTDRGDHTGPGARTCTCKELLFNDKSAAEDCFFSTEEKKGTEFLMFVPLYSGWKFMIVVTFDITFVVFSSLFETNAYQ
jgi:hypothetical protein